jgi:hypothetical protein
MLDGQVQVEGLTELRRELRKLEGRWGRELQKVNKSVAETVVVPEAKRRARESRRAASGNQTRVGSRGEESIRAGARQNAAYVRGGGARVPYFQGYEWGTLGDYPQFPMSSKEGHIIYPVIQERQTQIVETYGGMLDDLTKAAFPG